MQAIVIDAYAEVTCPFAHLGLQRLREDLEEISSPVEVHLRAWPLQWVDGEPLPGPKVHSEVQALRDQLSLTEFAGNPFDSWPTTTVPGHNLTAAANRRSPKCGLAVGLELRSMLFEDGLDISDPAILAAAAHKWDLPEPNTEPDPNVTRDHKHGNDRGVQGSPHFWVNEQDFFAPSIEVNHDDHDNLIVVTKPNRGPLAQHLKELDIQIAATQNPRHNSE